jgi:hypothetical protein
MLKGNRNRNRSRSKIKIKYSKLAIQFRVKKKHGSRSKSLKIPVSPLKKETGKKTAKVIKKEEEAEKCWIFETVTKLF